MEERLKNLTFGKALMISLALAGIYYFAMYNNGDTISAQLSKVTVEIDKNKAELKSLQQAMIDAERFEQTRAVLGAEMDRVMRAIPAELNSLELMKIISNEAKGVGSQINQITSPQNFRAAVKKPNPNEPPAFYEAVDIDIDITGTYNQIMLFMSNLTRLDKIITVRKLSLATKSSSNIAQAAAMTSPPVNLKAGLSAHTSVPEKPEAKPGAPAAPGAQKNALQKLVAPGKPVKGKGE